MRRYAFLVMLGCACSSKVVDAPDAAVPVPGWRPGTTLSSSHQQVRGYTDLRGLVHAHSVYSHDACDGAPVDDAGVTNAACLADFRHDLCRVKHDFVFLTDHDTRFSDTEFPAPTLFDATNGDALVDHGDGPTASWLSCGDGTRALVIPGTESAGMPVGLEHHVGTPATRSGVYDSTDNTSWDAFHDAGAVNLVAHTEMWSVDQLTSFHLDGFEMFNLHRNALKNGGVAADLVLNYADQGLFDGLPEPDLTFLAFDMDDPVYFQTWGRTLAQGLKRVTTMGTDCHRNSFPQLLADHERVDSYRRMMMLFSNHLLVKAKSDGTFDDRDLKDALRAGRNYGVFEFVGYASGFDVHVTQGSGAAATEHELGETTWLAQGLTLHATMPQVRDLDASMTQPERRLIVWRANATTGWDQVTSTTDPTLDLPLTTAGAYRVEVRMTPNHLLKHVGTRIVYAKTERPWVMTSAFYVDP